MRKVLVASLFSAALLLAGYSVAQTTGDLAPRVKKDQPPSAPVTVPLSVGTAFNTTLVDPIDTRKAKPGDSVTASTAEDVSYEQSLVFPKGTKVVGHIVRATSGGHGRTGSALFIQFDKAVLQDGEDVILNAGIQALAVNAVAPPTEGDATPDNQNNKPSNSEAMVPADGRPPASEAEVVSTVYDAPVRRLRDPLSPLPQGEIDSNGLFTPDSTGAFGRPDLKVYTPTLDGSHGTVLLSTKKNMQLDSGTRMLLVVQPPPSGDKAKTVDFDGIDQP
jgi:hypothetical protein